MRIEEKEIAPSCKVARELGYKYYIGTRQCKHGHPNIRRTINRVCLVCEYERSRDWAIANRDKKVESSVKWRRNNPEKSRIRYHNFVKKNPFYEVIRASRKRAEQFSATPRWADKKEIQYIFELAREKNQTVDHIIPLRSKYVCGLHCADNLRVIPDSLNKKKSNCYWPDMWSKERQIMSSKEWREAQ